VNSGNENGGTKMAEAQEAKDDLRQASLQGDRKLAQRLSSENRPSSSAKADKRSTGRFTGI
jgi:hypothetical protein